MSTSYEAGSFAKDDKDDIFAVDDFSTGLKAEFDGFVKEGKEALANKDPKTALEKYLRAVRIFPRVPEVHYQIGLLYYYKKDYDNATHYFQNTIDVKKSFGKAHYHLGLIFEHLKLEEQAINFYLSAVEHEPNLFQALNNLANLYQKHGDFKNASVYYRRATVIKPNEVPVLTNLAIALDETGKQKEADDVYHYILKLEPNNLNIHWNYGQLLLRTGELDRGFKEYEYRLHKDNYKETCYPFFYENKPRWLGEPLENKTLLVHFEQGLGDSIQFLRFIPRIKAENPNTKILFHCQASLIRLFQNLPYIDELITYNNQPVNGDKFDIYVSLLSLPSVFNITLENIPNDIPYLTPNPNLAQEWTIRLRHLEGVRIGFAWAGNPNHSNDINRSCHLNFFKIFSTFSRNTHWISLQKGKAEEQIRQAEKENNIPIRSLEILNMAPIIQDFADTAGIVHNLDIIITVDTALAHLAGALGKPVILLLPYVSDWRWLMNRNDSPWYPTIKIFRQPHPHDWTSVFKQVYNYLSHL